MPSGHKWHWSKGSSWSASGTWQLAKAAAQAEAAAGAKGPFKFRCTQSGTAHRSLDNVPVENLAMLPAIDPHTGE